MKIFDHCITQMKDRGISFDAGLTACELIKLKQALGAAFPPDYAAFLQKALPVGHGFPDWRAVAKGASHYSIEGSMAWPLEGLQFDVKHNALWLSSWGDQPASLQAQLQRVKHLVKQAPKLIPVYSHCYLPAIPFQAENPILSVYQSDVIYYGFDLPSYFKHEFSISFPDWYQHKETPTPISFWDDLVG